MTNDVKVKSVKRRRASSLDKKKARGGWLFVAPFVIGFILIYLPILIESVQYTFCDVSQADEGGRILTPVGWANYREALFGVVGADFIETLVNGLLDMVFDIPMILIFSLFMAVLLNQKMPGRAAFRAIFFIPVIISTGILDSIQEANNMAAAMEGGGIDDGSGASTSEELVSSFDVAMLFSNMAVGQGLVTYVTEAINNIFDIVNRSGVQMLIFLAGLQSISPAIYESVQIDGATAWETFWKITFPMISPMILVNAVYTVIDSFTSKSNVVMTFISNYQLTDNVVSSAMSWIYFLVVILIIAVVAGIFSAFVFYQKKD
ncbi:MAG: sugar ABC transporter permease [Clostridia bacterium]|nr:sugar ABC transporter permease [Clostridia bacterium]